MKRIALFPLATLVLAACQDTTQFPTGPQHMVSPPVPRIAFTPKTVEVSTFQGGSRSLDIIFESTQDLSNITVFIAPELQPVVTANPEQFMSISAGTENHVHLTFSVPAGTPLGSIDGTLKLKQGNRKLANPLPITVSVIRPVFENLLARTAAGLILEDLFNRPENDVVGNGWSEFETDLTGMRISANNDRLKTLLANEQRIHRRMGSGVVPDEVIVQTAANPEGSPIVGMGPLVRSTATEAHPSGDQYWLRFENIFQDTICVFKVEAGSITQSECLDIAVTTAAWRGIRMVLEVSGTDLIIRGYRSASNLSSGEDRSKEFVLDVTMTDMTPIPNDDAHDGLGISTKNFGSHDALMLMGRNIVVTGLPTGYQIEVDSRGKVTEVGGTVTLDVDLWALPATSIKMYDAASVLKATVTPAGGIYGGDRYTAS